MQRSKLKKLFLSFDGSIRFNIQGRRRKKLEKQILTPAQITYLLGKKYEAEKHAWGATDGFRGNQHNCSEISDFTRTSERIASEYGVGAATVLRAEHYAKGVDAAEAACPGMKQAILSGSFRLTKQKVIALSKLAIEDVAYKLLEYIENLDENEGESMAGSHDNRAQQSSGTEKVPNPSCIMIFWN